MACSPVAVVDRAALKHNIALMRSQLNEDTLFMAVVKANAYGHGMVETAKAALDAGAEYLAVALPEEGCVLREAGISAPILVIGGILPGDAEVIIKYDLRASVFSLPVLRALQSAAVDQNKAATIHVKIDSGLNRIGVIQLSELEALLLEIKHCKVVSLEGIFTHFAVSDLPDKTFSLQQVERFNQAVALAKRMGFTPIVHAANSGGIWNLSDKAEYDMVRGGISMYGYPPGPGLGAGLQPVMSWKAPIVQIKEINAGDTVSYGRRYTAQGPTRIATLHVGYGDGYHRCMSGKAQVIIGGKRVPVVGTICMDQCMADVSAVPDVKVGDEAILLGKQGDCRIDADEMAEWAGTISYEVLLSISARVPRVFI